MYVYGIQHFHELAGRISVVVYILNYQTPLKVLFSRDAATLE